MSVCVYAMCSLIQVFVRAYDPNVRGVKHSVGISVVVVTHTPSINVWQADVVARIRKYIFKKKKKKANNKLQLY